MPAKPTLELYEDFVFVRLLPPREVTDGGIIVPGMVQDRHEGMKKGETQVVRVLSCGPNAAVEVGSHYIATTVVKDGVVVPVRLPGYYEFGDDKPTHVIIRESQLVAKVTGYRYAEEIE